MPRAERSPAPVFIVEFDDVLAETRVHRLASIRTALAEHGVTFTDDKYDLLCTGLSTDAAVRAICRSAGATLDATAHELAAHQADRTFAAVAARGITLAPGARDFVLGAAGVARLAIATRAVRNDVDVTLALAGLEDAFEVIISREDYSGVEPAPMQFELGSHRLAQKAPVMIAAEVALVASLNGVAASRAARCIPVVVGPASPTLALAGEAYLRALDCHSAKEILRITATRRGDT